MSDAEQSVILQEVTISGYRSCEGTVFRPHPHLSALIGINGVGKTNILNAIHLLSPQDVGRFSRAAHDEQSNAKTQISAWFLVSGKRIGLRVTLVLSSASRNNGEVLDYTEEWNFASLTGSRKWFAFPSFLIFGDTKRSRLYPRELLLRRHSSASQGELFYASDPAPFLKNEEVRRAIERIVQFRQSINYYSASQFTDPTRCPSNFELDGDKRLEAGIRSHSSHLRFLFDLYSLRDKNIDLYNEYVAFISRQQLGLISRLSWKEIKLSSHTAEVRSQGAVKKVKRYKTLIVPRLQIGSSHITFNQLSEGTFKTLAMIFYIMTDASSCLLIEEPEVCVHHGLLTRIVNTISAYSVAKQVIFSTHSDLVLDNISQDNVFVVDMHKAITHVANLSVWAGAGGLRALNAYLQETGTLGEYWRSGGFSS